MVKTLRLPLMIALCILLVTACSSSSEDASGDGRNGDGGSSKGEDEQITLRMTWWGDQPRHDYTLEVIELYQEQNPGVKIEAEYASWDDYWQKLAPQAAANELPDIIQMDLSYISQYAQNNQLADLSPYVGEQIDVSNMADTIVSAGEIDGGLYGFNTGVNAVGFNYDPAALEKIGIDSLPEDWTWDDYIEISDKAADAGIYFDSGMQPDVFFN